jgi:hypothetical protein
MKTPQALRVRGLKHLEIKPKPGLGFTPVWFKALGFCHEHLFNVFWSESQNPIHVIRVLLSDKIIGLGGLEKFGVIDESFLLFKGGAHTLQVLKVRQRLEMDLRKKL